MSSIGASTFAEDLTLSDAQAPLASNTASITFSASKTPATATAAGEKGEFAWDSNYLYYCEATNTWLRAPLVNIGSG